MESDEIELLARLVEMGSYSAAAFAANQLEDSVLEGVRTNLEFCLDIVGEVQRQRSTSRAQ